MNSAIDPAMAEAKRRILKETFGFDGFRAGQEAVVLEKAGYVLEARLRRSAIKDGRIIDQLQYAFITPE